MIRLDPAPRYHECERCGVRGYSKEAPVMVYQLSLGDEGPRVYLCPDHLAELRKVLGEVTA